MEWKGMNYGMLSNMEWSGMKYGMELNELWNKIWNGMNMEWNGVKYGMEWKGMDGRTKWTWNGMSE